MGAFNRNAWALSAEMCIPSRYESQLAEKKPPDALRQIVDREAVNWGAGTP